MIPVVCTELPDFKRKLLVVCGIVLLLSTISFVIGHLWFGSQFELQEGLMVNPSECSEYVVVTYENMWGYWPGCDSVCFRTEEEVGGFTRLMRAQDWWLRITSVLFASSFGVCILCVVEGPCYNDLGGGM